MLNTDAQDKKRNQIINIRTTKRQRDLIDQAAEASGKTRSDFMLETACNSARDILLNYTYFTLSPNDFHAFAEMLDTPPLASDALKQLLKIKAPWE